MPGKSYPSPAGGHYSTVGDLLRFVNALLEDRLLQPETTKAALARQVTKAEEPGCTTYYGYGFEILAQWGTISVGHSGAYAGISTNLSVYPDLGYTVIVLSNYSFVAKTVARHIGELIAPQ